MVRTFSNVWKKNQRCNSLQQLNIFKVYLETPTKKMSSSDTKPPEPFVLNFFFDLETGNFQNLLDCSSMERLQELIKYPFSAPILVPVSRPRALPSHAIYLS